MDPQSPDIFRNILYQIKFQNSEERLLVLSKLADRDSQYLDIITRSGEEVKAMGIGIKQI